MSEEKERFRLSPSRITKYQSCPLAYKFHYLDKVEGKYNINLAYGTVLHNLLEYFLKTKMDTGELLGVSDLKIYAKTFLESIQKQNSLDKDVCLKATDHMNLFIPIIHDKYLKTIPLSLEQKVLKKVPGEEFDIYGFIDMIEKGDTSSEFNWETDTIVDYKTKKASPSKFKEEYILPKDHYLQTVIYAYCFLTDEAEYIRTRVDYLIKTQTPKIIQVTTEVSREEILETLEHIKIIYQQIKNKVFYPNFCNPYCHPVYCDYYDECKKRGKNDQ